MSDKAMIPYDFENDPLRCTLRYQRLSAGFGPFCALHYRPARRALANRTSVPWRFVPVRGPLLPCPLSRVAPVHTLTRLTSASR